MVHGRAAARGVAIASACAYTRGYYCCNSSLAATGRSRGRPAKEAACREEQFNWPLVLSRSVRCAACAQPLPREQRCSANVFSPEARTISGSPNTRNSSVALAVQQSENGQASWCRRTPRRCAAVTPLLCKPCITTGPAANLPALLRKAERRPSSCCGVASLDGGLGRSDGPVQTLRVHMLQLSLTVTPRATAGRMYHYCQEMAAAVPRATAWCGCVTPSVRCVMLGALHSP